MSNNSLHCPICDMRWNGTGYCSRCLDRYASRSSVRKMTSKEKLREAQFILDHAGDYPIPEKMKLNRLTELAGYQINSFYDRDTILDCIKKQKLPAGYTPPTRYAIPSVKRTGTHQTTQPVQQQLGGWATPGAPVNGSSNCNSGGCSTGSCTSNSCGGLVPQDPDDDLFGSDDDDDGFKKDDDDTTGWA